MEWANRLTIEGGGIEIFLYGTLFFLAIVLGRFYNEVADIFVFFLLFPFIIFPILVSGYLEGWECCIMLVAS